MATIGEALRDDGVDTTLRLAEQASNPTTPASGYGRLFAKADGLYFIDDAGTVTGPLGAGGGGSSAFSGARPFRSAALSLPNNTYTAVGFDAETFDTNTYHDNATNNTRLTAAMAGYYRLHASVRFDANGTGQRAVAIREGGSTYRYDAGSVQSSSTAVNVQSDLTLYLAAGAYLEVMAYQSSGGALGVGVGAAATFVEFEYRGT